MRLTKPLLFSLAVTTACAPSHKQQLEGALRYIGFADRPAECVASQMDSQLSREQMQNISDLIKEARKSARGNSAPMTVVSAAARLNDAEIMTVAYDSARVCQVNFMPW